MGCWQIVHRKSEPTISNQKSLFSIQMPNGAFFVFFINFFTSFQVLAQGEQKKIIIMIQTKNTLFHACSGNES